MRYKIKTRDWKGIYDDLDDVKCWFLVGGEDEIDTGCDSQALVFSDRTTCLTVTDGVEFDLSPQKAYDIWLELYGGGVEELEGYTYDEEDHELIVRK